MQARMCTCTMLVVRELAERTATLRSNVSSGWIPWWPRTRIELGLNVIWFNQFHSSSWELWLRDRKCLMLAIDRNTR